LLLVQGGGGWPRVPEVDGDVRGGDEACCDDVPSEKE
jgi:hypothetical protein